MRGEFVWRAWRVHLVGGGGGCGGAGVWTVYLHKHTLGRSRSPRVGKVDAGCWDGSGNDEERSSLSVTVLFSESSEFSALSPAPPSMLDL